MHFSILYKIKFILTNKRPRVPVAVSNILINKSQNRYSCERSYFKETTLK